jgi:hypothetical protein
MKSIITPVQIVLAVSLAVVVVLILAVCLGRLGEGDLGETEFLLSVVGAGICFTAVVLPLGVAVIVLVVRHKRRSK